jgi:hypothetical protein
MSKLSSVKKRLAANLRAAAQKRADAEARRMGIRHRGRREWVRA